MSVNFQWIRCGWNQRALSVSALIAAISLSTACGDSGSDDAVGADDLGSAAGGMGSGAGGTQTGAGGAGELPGTGGGDTGGGNTQGAGGVSTGAGGGAINNGTGGVIENIESSNIVVTVSLSDAIKTVGIVEFTIDKDIDGAYIEFGRNGAVEYTAPVDLSATAYRTLLLGMKQDTTYTVRVVAHSGDIHYVSDPVSITTGMLSAPLPAIQMTENLPGESFDGFTVACSGTGNAVNTASSYKWAFIFDKDGDYVWGLDLVGTVAEQCNCARMSHDGQHLWAGPFNNASGATPNGALLRVSMDGIEHTEYTTGATSGTNVHVDGIDLRHHHFTVMPSGNILYPERHGSADSEPDSIVEMDPATGATTLLFDEATLTGISQYHTNYVSYIPSMNAFSFSMRHSNTIVLADYPSGATMGIFSGDRDEFGVSWQVQHGHQFTSDSLLVFNNASPAKFLEFTYDLDQKSTGPVATYTGGPNSLAFGDVQRLPNGNTYITYSNDGAFHEVNASNTLVKSFKTDPIGYSEYRLTLYGPPPRLL